MQKRKSLRARLGVAATAIAIGAGALTATATGAGTANAAGTYPLNGCIGLSPNIVDQPYMPTRALVSDYDGRTYITTEYSSLWLFVGYDSTARLDWHNLSTGKRGSLFSNGSPAEWRVGGTHNFAIATRTIGPGRVKITLNSVNRNALWSIPAASCSGYIRV